jgi:hypothetical protein
MRSLVLVALVAAACTPHNRKPGIAIGGVMTAVGVVSVLPSNTDPNLLSDTDAAMGRALGVGLGIAGLAVLTVALLTGWEDPPSHRGVVMTLPGQ